jgi:hypothetical protein
MLPLGCLPLWEREGVTLITIKEYCILATYVFPVLIHAGYRYAPRFPNSWCRGA